MGRIEIRQKVEQLLKSQVPELANRVYRSNVDAVIDDNDLPLAAIFSNEDDPSDAGLDSDRSRSYSLTIECVVDDSSDEALDHILKKVKDSILRAQNLSNIWLSAQLGKINFFHISEAKRNLQMGKMIFTFEYLDF